MFPFDDLLAVSDELMFALSGSDESMVGPTSQTPGGGRQCHQVVDIQWHGRCPSSQFLHPHNYSRCRPPRTTLCMGVEHVIQYTIYQWSESANRSWNTQTSAPHSFQSVKVRGSSGQSPRSIARAAACAHAHRWFYACASRAACGLPCERCGWCVSNDCSTLEH